MEYGIVMPRGISHVRMQLPLVLEAADNGLSDLFREVLNELYQELVHLDKRLEAMEGKLLAISAQNEDCQRLLSIPGIGLLTATALVAAIGDISAFKSGRELAAWLGLVPRQHSTGGKSTLMGISKRGDSYLRTLLIHGGRTVVRVAHKYTDRKNRWISELDQRRGKNISAVAVANKNARIAWALLTKKTTYQVKAA
jgi:transposase